MKMELDRKLLMDITDRINPSGKKWRGCGRRLTLIWQSCKFFTFIGWNEAAG